MCTTAAYYFHRQGPDLRAVLLRSVGLNSPPAERVVSGPRRPGLCSMSSAGVQIVRHLRRQHRHPDGWLVPKGDQTPSTTSTPQNSASGGWPGKPFPARHHSTADRGRRYLSGLGKGCHRRGEWVGPYDDEKLGFYKVAKYYTIPAGGGRHGAALSHQFGKVDACRRLINRCSDSLRLRQSGCSGAI